MLLNSGSPGSFSIWEAQETAASCFDFLLEVADEVFSFHNYRLDWCVGFVRQGLLGLVQTFGEATVQPLVTYMLGPVKENDQISRLVAQTILEEELLGSLTWALEESSNQVLLRMKRGKRVKLALLAALYLLEGEEGSCKQIDRHKAKFSFGVLADVGEYVWKRIESTAGSETEKGEWIVSFVFLWKWAADQVMSDLEKTEQATGISKVGMKLLCLLPRFLVSIPVGISKEHVEQLIDCGPIWKDLLRMVSQTAGGGPSPEKLADWFEGNTTNDGIRGFRFSDKKLLRVFGVLVYAVFRQYLNQAPRNESTKMLEILKIFLGTIWKNLVSTLD